MADFTMKCDLGFNLVTCCECGVAFALTDDFIARRRRDHANFWCPNGHSSYYPAENAEEKLRRQVHLLQQAEARHEDEKRELRQQWDEAEKRAATAERARKRVETRVKNGICPDCNRSFANLARHMKSKHAKPCAGLH